MAEPDRETRDLLIEIKTMLGVVVSRGEDHEIRLREVEQAAVTKEDLAEERAASDARQKRALSWATTIIGILAWWCPPRSGSSSTCSCAEPIHHPAPA
ncbi:hypothetical protein BJF83_17265 [Nocardiopsis sp. CNR-923]|uniref:hypothetical protein n=1 Tax=Nocardiopsis sp. CNR-923 TaxID=1904965 RepID=UPI000968B030|nr:hypothetical protein [Nocardiopsis sp. CNR-923]OLT27736.1 hypothetical protein BJF83_17265 [Nocardiopsis sp. CNR-923]